MYVEEKVAPYTQQIIQLLPPREQFWAVCRRNIVGLSSTEVWRLYPSSFIPLKHAGSLFLSCRDSDKMADSRK